MHSSNPLSRKMVIGIAIISVVFVALFFVLSAISRAYAWNYFILILALIAAIFTILLIYVRRINAVIAAQADKENAEIRRDLTQNIAHELKTPVASIQGYLETLLENPDVDEQTRRQFIERSFAQSQRLTSLLQDISTLNRMDAKAPAYKIEAVDIYSVVESIAGDTALQRSKAGVTFNSFLPRPLIIRGDYSLLYGIFRNLLDNAILYSGPNTTVTLSASKGEGFWRFVFSDNGAGVPPQHLGRLFERFYRVDKGRSRKLGGTGLGLAIVKNAVHVHGGEIEVFNNETGGLRFEFTLKADNF